MGASQNKAKVAILPVDKESTYDTSFTTPDKGQTSTKEIENLRAQLKT